MTGTVRVARSYRVDARRVFDAWLDPAIAGRWLFATATGPMTDVRIDARVAGSFRFVGGRGEAVVAHSGEYVAIVPPRRLVFTLSETWAEPTTLVTVEIVPQRAGCRLALAQERVSTGRVADWRARWTGILFGLGVTLAAMPRAAVSPSRSENRTTREGELSCTTC